ncbi:hypothetical protein DPMN_055546 [Dreissena polymorpha]|uniref:Uncharacterized protein n=1 Tax=Dreissena polymorpha TaxID=45954 RepID=A0A9D4CST7_DREPO|nr:hypothetical protein DPMN_055546 [Dreissena polymorpha]
MACYRNSACLGPDVEKMKSPFREKVILLSILGCRAAGGLEAGRLKAPWHWHELFLAKEAKIWSFRSALMPHVSCLQKGNLL